MARGSSAGLAARDEHVRCKRGETNLQRVEAARVKDELRREAVLVDAVNAADSPKGVVQSEDLSYAVGARAVVHDVDQGHHKSAQKYNGTLCTLAEWDERNAALPVDQRQNRPIRHSTYQQVRRSMHQDCLLKPRNFVFYPFFTHFPPFFAHFQRLDARNPENTTRSPGENGKKSREIGENRG